MEGRTIQITNLLEVGLAADQWHRIKICAIMRRKTYTNITRYCVLRLARKCALQWTTRMRAAETGVKKELRFSPLRKRHMVCLYGEDEKLIRLAAMDLGITMSAFIRLALELYLPLFSNAMEKRSQRRISNEKLKGEGIRFLQEVQIYAENAGGWPFSRQITCIPFELSTYW